MQQLFVPGLTKRATVSEQLNRMTNGGSIKINKFTDPDGKIRAVVLVLPDAAAYSVLDAEMMDRDG